jgi:RNA polymerase sigma factor (sigma-70 family)
MDKATAATLHQRLTELDSDIKAIASYTLPDHRDDIFQSLVTLVIEETEKNPDFIKQKDEYILKFCSWRAKNIAKSFFVYEQHITSNIPGECQHESDSTEDDDSESGFQNFTDDFRSAEDEAIENEKISYLSAVISSMNNKDQKIVTMLFLGYSKKEIADELGLAKSTITGHTVRISQRLAKLSI